MLIAFTYLPGFVTLVFRGMPTVWRGRHRLIFCWLIFMQAVSPGRKTLEEMPLTGWSKTTSACPEGHDNENRMKISSSIT